MKRVGLFFGTFNPIHVGHLIIANYVADYTDTEEVWFIVSPHNPLKDKKTLLADHHRLALVRIAIEDNSKLKVSNVEFGMPQPSYTVDTLAYLSEKYPEYHFRLILGQDNLRSLHKWKNIDQIVAEYELLVYPRAFVESEMGKEKRQVKEYPGAQIIHLEGPVMNISASFIRKAIRSGRDVRYMLTEPVEKYIREMHFYEK